MAEQKVLRTAANGLQVWIPISKLDEWEKAQEEMRKNPEANREAEELLKSAMQRKLQALKRNRRGKSE